MAVITESKLKNGTFTLGAGPTFVKFATQATNIRITPATKADGEPVETQDGSSIAAAKTTTYTIKAKSIQDFTDPEGLQAYSWTHDGEEVPFTWAPSGAAGPTYSGVVSIDPLEVGGDTVKRLDVDIEWTLTAKPDVVYPQAG